MMSNFRILAMLPLLVAIFGAGRAGGAFLVYPTTMSFSTIDRGTLSGIEDFQGAVVRDEAAWRELWSRHRPSESLPAVDFGTEMVAGIFVGTKPTAGYEVEIVEVAKEADGLFIRYRETSPAPDALVAQILTQPFHLVRLPRADLPASFQKIKEEISHG